MQFDVNSSHYLRCKEGNTKFRCIDSASDSQARAEDTEK